MVFGPQVDSDFGDVNREVRKIITKDSNVQVVSEAIACTGMLAKGLRKGYRGTAAALCPGAPLGGARMTKGPRRPPHAAARSSGFKLFASIPFTSRAALPQPCAPPHAPLPDPVLLEKFKDKAAVVTRAAGDALGLMHRYCFTLGDVAEEAAAALGHQNPKVRVAAGGRRGVGLPPAGRAWQRALAYLHATPGNFLWPGSLGLSC